MGLLDELARLAGGRNAPDTTPVSHWNARTNSSPNNPPPPPGIGNDSPGFKEAKAKASDRRNRRENIDMMKNTTYDQRMDGAVNALQIEARKREAFMNGYNGLAGAVNQHTPMVAPVVGGTGGEFGYQMGKNDSDPFVPSLDTSFMSSIYGPESIYYGHGYPRMQDIHYLSPYSLDLPEKAKKAKKK